MDRETGMYYYGARYYDPRISIFVSVDPLAEKYPNYTPYHYVHQNPINMIDPTGMEADWVPGKNGERVTYTEDTKGNVTFENLQDDLKPLFEELVKTETGKKELLSLLDDDDMKVSINVLDEKGYNFDGRYNAEVPINGKFTVLDTNKEKTAITEALITIYKGWYAEDHKKHKDTNAYYNLGSMELYFKDFTENQLNAGTLGHEIMHRYPENNATISPDKTTGEREHIPTQTEIQIYKEMLLNKDNKKR